MARNGVPETSVIMLWRDPGCSQTGDGWLFWREMLIASPGEPNARVKPLLARRCASMLNGGTMVARANSPEIPARCRLL